MAKITANGETLLKKEAVPASELKDDQTVLVPIGSVYEIVWQGPEIDKHVKVSLANGAGNWYVYAPHWSGLEQAKSVKTDSKVLDVPYYSQRDNTTQGSDNWTRTCFSSSCAMLANYVKPGCVKGDDDYISKRRRFGDSTDASAQVACLRSLGIKARYVQNLNNADLIEQINRGKPVPVGILHHGPASAPNGGGHWLIVIGYDSKGFIVHDPWGEIDNASGTYVSTYGKGLHYSYRLFDSRWTVFGPSDGWAILVD